MLLTRFQCYFLLAGDETRPIYFHVSRLRDGGSYVTRLVEAKQKGKCIFVLFSVSVAAWMAAMNLLIRAVKQHANAHTAMLLSLQSYARPEPGRPRFAVGLPKAVSPANMQMASASDASSSSSEITANNPTVLQQPSRFSTERAPDGHPVHGLIPYDEAPLNEMRYRGVLKDLDNVLPDKAKRSLQEWIKDREESAVEIRWVLEGMRNGNLRFGSHIVRSCHMKRRFA